MCTNPKLLCLDEPAAGLNPKESSELNKLLRFIKTEKQTGILLIEHDMSVVMGISDHVVVLNYGKKIFEGTAKDTRNSKEVIEAYSGSRRIMLDIKNIQTFYGKIQALRDVSIKVNTGEIVSLIGANGAGKSTLLMTVSGINKPREGVIIFEGKNIEKEEPHKIVKLGISQSPEGRRIFSKLTVEENLKLGSNIYENGKNYLNDIKEIFELFPVLSDRKTQRGGTLSGGEQQMLAIGRALMARPKMLLLDEPSLGIAPKLVNQIFVA